MLKSLNLRRNIYFFETPSSSPLKGTSVICLRIKMATLYLHVNLTPPVLRGWGRCLNDIKSKLLKKFWYLKLQNV